MIPSLNYKPYTIPSLNYKPYMIPSLNYKPYDTIINGLGC